MEYFTNNRPRPILKLDFRKISSRDSFLNSFRVFSQLISQEAIIRKLFRQVLASKTSKNGGKFLYYVTFSPVLENFGAQTGKCPFS